jgi:hypothetical protein
MIFAVIAPRSSEWVNALPLCRSAYVSVANVTWKRSESMTVPEAVQAKAESEETS